MTKKEDHPLLIVESDETLLRQLYLIFHRQGFAITSATNGESGLKLAAKNRPEAILVDLALPKMTGLDFLANVKAHGVFKDIPVVVLTSLSDFAQVEKAKNLGAVDFFVTADTDLDSLVVKVKKLVA